MKPTTVTEVDYDPFAESTDLARVVPTTEAQREVWLADSLGREGSLAFNESISLRLQGPLNVAALQETLRVLSERHEALRATVSADGLELLIAANGSLAAEMRDLRGGSRDRIEQQLAELRREAVESPFDLARGPLVRAVLARTADDDHTLILTCHHIICDGWSFGVIVRELVALYTAIAAGKDPGLPPADSFAEYSSWLLEREQEDQARADEQYWVAQYDRGVPVLDLPSDKPRPPVRSFDASREDVRIPASLVADLRKVAARSGASLFSLLFGFFSGLMARLSAAETVVVGVPSAGQSTSGKELLVGHCVNLLPVRVDVDLERPAREFLSSAQRLVLDAYDHQQCTFGSLLKKLRLDRDPSRLPLVSVQFNLDQRIAPEDLAVPGLQTSLETNARTFENFEIFVNATQAPDGIILECQYSTTLFEAGTIRRWMELYREALARFAANPDQRLGDLFAATQADLAIIAEQNATEAPYELEGVVHQLIARAAEAAGSAIAIRSTEAQLTYQDLEGRSNQLARLLRDRGVTRGKLVGLCLPRTPEMVIAQLAVLKAGAAYVPLDPGFPPERLAYMAEDAHLSLLLTTSSLSGAVKWPREQSVWIDDDAKLIEAHARDRLPPAPQADAGPMDPAYIIYTSGSTGKPKGVVVHHQAVVNFLETMAQRPGLVQGDRLVAVTTLSFDIAVLELLLPLTVGAQVILAKREESLDGAVLKNLLEQHAATVMQATPATWRLLLEAGWQGAPDFKALVGGEALPQDLAHELTSRAAEVWNMYGPTETTVWSTCWLVPKQANVIRIGTPIANTQIHVLDEKLRPCPIGVAGEMFIGGDGVTLGYWERPELTSERFIADPFRKFPGAKLYRTGDRGRWCADGQLEHLGRLDFQVKVRGFRIELGEIEAKLAAHPSVGQCVVVVREDRKNDVRLVAYIIPRAPLPDSAELKAFLRTTLPEYMLPQHFVELDAFPLTPNGKIDRKRLPAPSIEQASTAPGSAAAPRGEFEGAVARAMADVLQLPNVGIHDNFFELGGHSLLAAQLCTRLGEIAGERPGLRVIFEAPTVAKLAERLRGETKQARPANALQLVARPDQSRALLSLQQQSMWLQEEMHPGHVANNIPSAHRLKGPLDVAVFERALQAIVRRQSALRTRIESTEHGPVQLVRDDVTVNLQPVRDLTHLSADEQTSFLAAEFAAYIKEPFVLRDGGLFRLALYKVAPEEHVLFFMVHHLVWDGWSFDLLYFELAELYPAIKAGREPTLPQLPFSYGDYAEAQRAWLEGPECARQLAFWREELSPLPSPLELPVDSPRPARMSGEGRSHQIFLPPELTKQLHDLCSSKSSTLYTALLSTFTLLLHRLTNQDDLVIGTPFRGREQQDLEKIMGYFANVLPLRMKPSAQDTFEGLLQKTRGVVTRALSCPDVPFEHLVRELNIPRDPSRPILIQSLFSFQDVRDRPTTWADIRHERYDIDLQGSVYDLSLWCVETRGGVECVFMYNTDILAAATVERFAQRYLHLLQQILRDSSRSLESYSFVCEEELALLREWNATAKNYDLNMGIHELIREQVQRTPNKIAIRDQDRALTYRELDEQTNRIARVLRARGAQRGTRVGISVNRSVDMICALVGVLKSGAAYIPLDPEYPAERLSYMAEDSSITLLVAESATAEAITFPRDRTLLLDVDASLIHSESGAEPAADPARDALPTDPAYVIYTSGSTGKAKGVVVPHCTVVNLLRSMAEEPGLTAEDKWLAITTPSFDMSIPELYLPLAVGAEMLIATTDQARNGTHLRTFIERDQVSVFQATPGTWRLLLEAGWQGSRKLKALIGAEPLPTDLAQTLLERVGELWNMYGPTETTVWSTAWKVQRPEEGIAVGRPIANTQVYVLDERKQVCPIGVPGEIYIGGSGVTSGYWNRPELTAERFIDDPFSKVAGAKLYRTGDRGRWRNDGELEHLGRLDFQIKLRGYRIELGEIETALAAHPGVARVLVIVREDQPGDARLVAYVVPNGQMPAPADLRDHLRRTLPAYMLPQHYVELPHIPLLPNGKVDRKALPKPLEAVASSGAEYVAPSNEVETAVARLWEELLRVPRVGMADNFFELGGHSLLAVRVLAGLERRFGVNIPLAVMLHEQTCGALAQVVSAQLGAQSRSAASETQDGGLRWAPLVKLQEGDRQKRPPLFCIHPVGGNVLHYRQLAIVLPNDQPVYGLQAIGLDGITLPLESIEEMAKRYCDEIRAVQPQGPYYLCGGSMGGTIAFEMARQFESQGDRVALLALFDTWGPAMRRARTEEEPSFVRRALAAIFNGDLIRRLKKRGARRRDAQFVRECRERGVPIPQELRWRVVEAANHRALAVYAEGPYNGRITLLRAIQNEDSGVTFPDLGWGEVARGGIDILEMPGAHGDFIEQPEVAQALRKVLLQVQEQEKANAAATSPTKQQARR